MHFQTTKNYPCSYIPGKLARSRVVLAIDSRSDTDTYARLIHKGYRRNGNFLYRPDCAHCHACIPVRIPVKLFHPHRTQRRTWKHHQNLRATRHPLHFDSAHFALYQRYQKSRHPGGGMELDDKNGYEQYCNFFLHSTIDSFLVTFHEDQQLRMVSIVDQLPDGLSSVYTFFDPNIARASYGTFNILWQIAQCQQDQLPYLYLGYWIKNNPKMRYKANFRPLQLLLNNQWQCQQNTT
ncbi:aspartateglutamate leucyltransferase [Nitrosomonas stercoris]|uniref:Aspartate/glutamate leucyltransferase n=1 Tax=Nitrosomonas stercoris TaxID=1444684 RepID=A0A4Y1YK24_9PROT|nr:aspartateglutamate leucyltransferase [Nitrosomonas stercoris]